VTFVAFLALLAAAEVEVRSSTHCPSAEDVFAHLAPLLPTPEGKANTGPDLANLQLTAMAPDGTSEIRIELISKDGVRIGERRVVGRGSCSDKAEAVAAVLAAWETDPSPAMATAETSPTKAEVSAPVTPNAPRDQAEQASRLNVTLAVGGGVALVGGVAGAAKTSIAAGLSDSHWQLQIDALVESNRRIELDAGYVDWHHATVGLALGWRALSSRIVFATDLGAVAGWASLEGNDFDQNRTRTAFEYGIAAGARAGRAWGRWQLWMELRPRLWLRGQQAVLTAPPANQPATADVPVWDVLVCAGASVVLLR
jgi:hypothetical protein